MTLDEWMAAVCEELGIGPVNAKAILDFAREVAHGIDRPAAPLTCLLIGLAAQSADEVGAILERVRALLPDS